MTPVGNICHVVFHPACQILLYSVGKGWQVEHQSGIYSFNSTGASSSDGMGEMTDCAANTSEVTFLACRTCLSVSESHVLTSSVKSVLCVIMGPNHSFCVPLWEVKQSERELFHFCHIRLMLLLKSFHFASQCFGCKLDRSLLHIFHFICVTHYVNLQRTQFTKAQSNRHNATTQLH